MRIYSKQKIRIPHFAIKKLINEHASKCTIKTYLSLLLYASNFEIRDKNKRAQKRKQLESTCLKDASNDLVVKNVNIKTISSVCSITPRTVKASLNHLIEIGLIKADDLPNQRKKAHSFSVILPDYYLIYLPYSKGGSGGYRDTDKELIYLLLKHQNVNSLKVDMLSLSKDKASQKKIIHTKEQLESISSTLKSKKEKEKLVSMLYRAKVRKDTAKYVLKDNLRPLYLKLHEHKKCIRWLHELDNIYHIMGKLKQDIQAICKLAETHTAIKVVKAVILMFENYIIPDREYLASDYHADTCPSGKYRDMVSAICNNTPCEMA